MGIPAGAEIMEQRLMVTQYKANFIIDGNDDAGAGVGRLRQVVDLVMEELQAATGATAPDLEQGATTTVGYAGISAERPYPVPPGQPELSVRLEARFCAVADQDGDDGDRDAVAAQISTRFISADGSDPPELLAGPPRLLREIVQRFPCRSGVSPVANAVARITAADAVAFTNAQLLNPERTLPILVITERPQGGTAIDPERALALLLGVAQVAHFDASGPQGAVAPCYNGSVRMYWPLDIQRQGYYSWNAAAALSLASLQRDCLANAPESDFDYRFSLARAEVILERNRQLESEQRQWSAMTPPAPDAAPADAEISRLRRELRRAELRGNEASRKLGLAQGKITQLQSDLAAANEQNEYINEYLADAADAALPATPDDTNERRDAIRKLRAANRELREKDAQNAAAISRLNDESQSLKQELNQRRDGDRRDGAIKLTGGPADGVTALNHAVNIYRDRMRQFIVAVLRAEFGNDLANRLDGVVELTQYRTRELAAVNPQAFIDVDVFENVVGSYPECFGRSGLAERLRDIRRIRNNAAHPPPQGIDDISTQDGLRRIAETLSLIGAAPAESAVRDLIDLMRRRQ